MPISNNSSGFRPGVCTSTTRPQAPFEGQMIYETDTDMLAIWNGSAWRYVAATTPTNGTVLQVVSQEYATEVSSTSQSWVTTGLNATITPKSSSSKILIISQVNCSVSSGTNNLFLTVFRGTVSGTNLGSTAQGFGLLYSAGGRVDATFPISYLDSPSTISAQTYTIAMYAASGITATAQKFGSKSSLVLMEIAG